jgi:hypothetical protein
MVLDDEDIKATEEAQERDKQLLQALAYADPDQLSDLVHQLED